MGKYNSSIYRVRPLMELIEGDYSAFSSFISLVGLNGLGKPLLYRYDGVACKEMKIKPTKQHLISLIDYMSTKKHDIIDISGQDRRNLFFGSGQLRKDTRNKAIALLEKNYDKLTPSSRFWYIFEGYTNPDIFIEGDDYVIICEGKWTEAQITTKTTHLSAQNEYRNQMIRHIQGGLNYTKKRIYAFYIVDKDCGYTQDLTKESLKHQLELETIKINDEEKAMILSSFYGFTTWQDIKERLPSVVFLDKKEIK